jgi:N-formylglutamate amidohydrolase
VAEGPAYRVLPGAADSPVILHVPHGSRTVPDAVRAGILLADAELAAELDLLTDAHTGLIAAGAVDALPAARAPWRFVNERSRLVVDPERFPDGREEMAAVGMAAVYTRTAHGKVLRAADPVAEERLLAAYYRPYAAAMTELVAERLAAVGRAVVIDVHSYQTAALPYELHADGPRPPVCLGTDPFHTPTELLEAGRAAFARCGEVGTDSPFAGCYVPLRHYRSDARVGALMIELRRDGYMSEPGGAPHGGLDERALALARLVAAAG